MLGATEAGWRLFGIERCDGHRGDGGVVSRARATNARGWPACSEILRSQRIEVNALLAELTKRNFCANCNRIGSVPCSMSKPIRGSNAGSARRGLCGRIVSFELLPRPFAVLQRSASTDPVVGMPVLCAGRCRETIRSTSPATRAPAVPSLLMLKRHQDAFPQPTTWAPNGADTRLDSWLQTFCGPTILRSLKIDVQGFEKQVIAGGDSTVHDRMRWYSSSCLSSRTRCALIRRPDLVDSLGLPELRFPHGRMLQGRWHSSG